VRWRASKAFAALIVVVAASPAAWAIPIPPRVALAPLRTGWPALKIRVDVRNTTGADDTGKLTPEELRSRLVATNDVWAQCSVEFVARSSENVSAAAMDLPYEPKSQDDIQRVLAKLFPNTPTEAIPVMFAGPWNFFDPAYGVYLQGIGWYWMDGLGKVSKIGAMVATQRLFSPIGGALLAHELAHALSLPHTAEPKNLMGAAGTMDLTLPQCVQARDFAHSALKGFLQ